MQKRLELMYGGYIGSLPLAVGFAAGDWIPPDQQSRTTKLLHVAQAT